MDRGDACTTIWMHITPWNKTWKMVMVNFMLCISYHMKKEILDLHIVLIKGIHWSMGEVRALRKSEWQEKNRILGIPKKEEIINLPKSLASLTFKLLPYKLNLKNLSLMDYSWNVQWRHWNVKLVGHRKAAVILIYFPSCYSDNSMNIFSTNISSWNEFLARNEFLIVIGFSQFFSQSLKEKWMHHKIFHFTR